ncbi:SCO1860 family LAETG-anchored protein [Streptomyces marincola]|uniref:SCO1860 family LAETG-anchored protein n=1 Tax=Streptomyces marincola TaxID=2878388 RepID=UPI000A343B43|nr:SCO1860 family LAETG-anchored protein [Streptomyces marincola]
MNRTARRGATALLAATVLTTPATARADEAGDRSAGTASAAVLRAGLDVSLLDGGVRLPLTASLNEVSAPDGGGSADDTLLTATLEGVEDGQPFDLLRADVASASATTGADGAFAETSLAGARVHLPGLPLLSLIEVDAVSARASCPVGGEASAETVMPATATVLGRTAELTTEGTTEVSVPGVGDVTLALAQRESGDGTASASALDLNVAVDPLDLGVAEVTGTVTLAEAACTAPAPPGPRPQTGIENQPGERPEEGVGRPGDRPAEDVDLAETGGGSSTPYLVGGAAGLLAAGAATVLIARRRRAAAQG